MDLISIQDVQNLQKWAAQNDLIVIPLVQTFGHMEFVLKLSEFKDLREVICSFRMSFPLKAMFSLKYYGEILKGFICLYFHYSIISLTCP